MVPNDLTLWGMGTVRNLRAHWMLAEMGLDYEFHPVHPRSGETYSPDFLRLNPRHKVPVLRHGPLVVTESAAIVQYVSEAFPAPATVYVPSAPADRAKVSEWCYFVMSELDAHTLYVIRRHSTFKHLYGEAPVAVTAARDYFFDQLNAVASQVGRDGPYLFGEALSVADILLTTCLDWAVEYEFPLPEAIASYHRRALARPAYQAAAARTFANGKGAPVPNSV
jgi:glutathione S-transferase